MHIQINVRRVLGASALGLLLVFCAAASAACVTVELAPDDNHEVVVATPPPTEPEQPQPPTEPELWCGIEIDVEQTEIPFMAEGWTWGYPFETDTHVGYLEAIDGTLTDWLMVHVFSKETNVQRQYVLMSWTGTAELPWAFYNVRDVVVKDDGKVYILFDYLLATGNGQPGSYGVVLTIIDPANGSQVATYLWDLAQDAAHQHDYQMAFLDDQLVVGSYDLGSGRLSVREVHFDSGIGYVGTEQIVRSADPTWANAAFTLEADGGVLIYRLGIGHGLQTTRYRACD